MSLLGAFEITIPSGVLTKLNNASGGGGFAGTLLMGLTFALASFACVGPSKNRLSSKPVGVGPRRLSNCPNSASGFRSGILSRIRGASNS